MRNSSTLRAAVVGVVAGAIVAAVGPGCEDKTAPTRGAGFPKSAGAPVTLLKITIKSDGTLLVDGVATDLQKLDIKLGVLKANEGEVWYYRENARSEPPPIANAVLDLITKHLVAVSMSTKPDFSDYVDAEGVVHPRN
jgi:hypothetical protein